MLHLDKHDRLIMAETALKNDVNIFLKWYIDLELMGWQKQFHHALQPNITVLGGVGCGKTIGTATSAMAWTAMNTQFKFMNTAPTSWQAALMFNAVRDFAENTKYERFLDDIKSKPYPVIRLKNGSSMEFMTASDDIERLRGWEGDWMHLDEGGFIDSENTILFMRTRLRGRTPRGRPRLGRLSVTTTPTDVDWLWKRYDAAEKDPQNYLSMRVSTDMNEHLSERDVELMREALPPELRRIEMMAERPDFPGAEFPRYVVEQCQDFDMNLKMEEMVEGDTPGAIYQQNETVGCHKWEMPSQAGRYYVLTGDPGQDNPPNRNSGVVMVWDVTELPFTLVYLHWVYGEGRYTPFMNSYEYAYAKYQPAANGFDSTGSQKGWDELIFERDGLVVEQINFQGQKQLMLNALKMLMQNKQLRFPFIKGMRLQLTRYAQPDTKLNQDIVACMMMGAHLMRRFLPWNNSTGEETDISRSQTRVTRTKRRTYRKR